MVHHHWQKENGKIEITENENEKKNFKQNEK